MMMMVALVNDVSDDVDVGGVVAPPIMTAVVRLLTTMVLLTLVWVLMVVDQWKPLTVNERPSPWARVYRLV